MAKRIYLSPSNQINNTYATGGTNEMAQCDKIAKASATALKRCGFEVKVGKSGDSMANRCKESDAFKADIHMPIHTNACNGKVTGGTLVMIGRNTSAHKKAGQALLDAVGKISVGNDYTLRLRTDLYEINVPSAMTLYLEVEFHDTKTGSDWIRNNIDAIGEAIAKGMCNYFGVKYVAPTSNTQPTTNTKPSTSNTTTTKEMYRVGTAWKNGKCQNQKGAFTVLTNAKNTCNKYADHYVFNSKGEKVYTSTKATFKPYRVKVTANIGLNIRKQASTLSSKIGALSCGAIVTISKVSGKWGYIEDKKGWICLTYTSKV
jgi:N-acetylmuramoyl-L-alanine amidase